MAYGTRFNINGEEWEKLVLVQYILLHLVPEHSRSRGFGGFRMAKWSETECILRFYHVLIRASMVVLDGCVS